MTVSLVKRQFLPFLIIGFASVSQLIALNDANAQSQSTTEEPPVIQAPSALEAPLELTLPGTVQGGAATPTTQGVGADSIQIAPPEGAVPAFGGVSNGESVQVQTLRAIGADSSGTLTEGQGGFGDTMWSGSNRAVIEALINRIGSPTGLTTASLTRRLLLSSASVPSGEGKAGDFLEVRVRGLARAGRMSEIDALVSGISPSLKTEVTKRIEVDAVLLSGDDARACAMATAEVTASPAPYWTLILAYCQILGGQGDEADLAISLLQETGDVSANFVVHFAALRAKQPIAVIDPSTLSALDLAMMRTAGVTATDDLQVPDTPAYWPALSRLEGLPNAVRATASEKALGLDLMTSDDVKQIIDGMAFDGALIANALTSVDDLQGPLGRALLFQTAQSQTVATARAELIAKALQTAQRDGVMVATSRLFLPLIQRLPGSSELVWFADFGLRAAIAAGRADGGARWLQMMTAGAVFRPEMKSALDLILPRARVARVPGSDRWSINSFAQWRAALLELAPDITLNEQVWMLTALTAAGDEMTPIDWLIALNEPTTQDDGANALSPSAGVETALMAAGANQRVGETVAAALAAMTETRGQPGAASAFAMARALSEAGLDREARGLLLDVVLSKGL